MLDADWMTTFTGLHRLARHGRLTGLEHQYYLLLREQITDAILQRSRATLPDDLPRRRTIRMAQTFPVEIGLPSGPLRLLTRSLSSGGFGALSPVDPGVEPVRFSLHLQGSPKIAGLARATGRQTRQGTLLVSFAFVEIAAEDVDRLHVAIFDRVLSELKPD